MFKNVLITNYLGQTVKYSFEGPTINDSCGLFITDISGLGPVKADINMIKMATADGQVFNSSRLNGRNIVIKARFTYAKTVEDARQMSYNFFPVGKPVTIRVETDNRVAETTGYVESNTPNPFSEKSDVQISILCESSFLRGVGDNNNITTIFSNVVDKFEFKSTYSQSTKKWSNATEFTEEGIEFSELINKRENTVYYDGDIETGCIIRIHMLDRAKMINIVNIKTGEHMLIDTSKLCLTMSYPVIWLPEDVVPYAGVTATTAEDIAKLDAYWEQWGGTTFKLLQDNSTHYCKKGEVYKLTYTKNQDGTSATMKWQRVTQNYYPYGYFLAGDTITITTYKGNKSIILTRNGVKINMMNLLGRDAAWFQLSKGDNLFAYTAEYGESNIEFTIDTQTMYMGV